jgi:hypothetical protein
MSHEAAGTGGNRAADSGIGRGRVMYLAARTIRTQGDPHHPHRPDGNDVV